jgi:hypothetical protein
MTLNKRGITIGTGLAGPGRPAGSTNRATAEVRAVFSTLVTANQMHLQAWLDRVAAENPKGALDLYLRLAEYVLPKVQRIDLSTSDAGEPLVVNLVRFSDLKSPPNSAGIA